jgi:uncharacterized protein (TIGR02246 family)
MKIYILILPILLILISCDMKQKPLTAEEVEKIILAKERQALDRWAAGDPLGFLNNFTDDATYFDDIGAHNRLDGREAIKNYLESLKGKIPPHTYELVNPKLQVYGEVAILTMRYHGTSPDGQPGPPWKATSIYRLIDNEWYVVHAHWSLVKEQ